MDNDVAKKLATPAQRLLALMQTTAVHLRPGHGCDSPYDTDGLSINGA